MQPKPPGAHQPKPAHLILRRRVHQVLGHRKRSPRAEARSRPRVAAPQQPHARRPPCLEQLCSLLQTGHAATHRTQPCMTTHGRIVSVARKIPRLEAKSDGRSRGAARWERRIYKKHSTIQGSFYAFSMKIRGYVSVLDDLVNAPPPLRFPVKTPTYPSRNIVFPKPSLVTTLFLIIAPIYQKMWHLFRAGPGV